MHSLSALVVIGASLMNAAIGPDCVNGPLKDNKICDVSAAPAERAAALVAALLTSEKLDNLMSKSKGIARLGLPKYNWWGEAFHGVAGAPGINCTGDYKTATSFPVPLQMSAAFDDDLIFKIANIISNKAQAFGNGGVAPVDFWTPDINPFRDPRWGRGSETPGEHITRIKGYTKHLLAGLEGDKPKRKIIATCKHYVGYDMEAWGGTDRHYFDAKINMQDLAEYYMPPFQQCARDSKVGSVMYSYNATILRDHWNWTASNNYITSDCEDVEDIWLNHKYAKSNAEGTGLAFTAGMDNSCEYSGSSDIPGAFNQSYLSIPTINKALKRQYEGLVRAGYFDGAAATYANLGIKDINTPEAQQLSLRWLRRDLSCSRTIKFSVSLSLKNGSKVAMLGFWANDTSKPSGIYSGPAPYLHTSVWAGERLGLKMAIASGPILQSQNSTTRDNCTTDALAAAEKSDYILYFGGLDTSTAAEGFDRTSLSWPTAQVSLITKLAALGTGLHYTTFDAKFANNGNQTITYDIKSIMSNCTNQYPDTCSLAPIPITVTNTGNRTSDFVALAFIKGDNGPARYLLKTLISYKKVRDIAGGKTKSAEMQLTLGNLARVDEMGNTLLYPGEYTVMLDEPTNAEIRVVVQGEVTVLDEWPQPPAGRR